MTLPEPARNLISQNELLGGNAGNLRFSIASITLSDGSTIKMSAPGVTAIVGPNNAGKSTLLREIATALKAEPIPHKRSTRMLSSVSLTKSGSRADLLAWVAEHASFGRISGGEGFASTHDLVLTPQWLETQGNHYWSNGSDSFGVGHLLYDFLVHHADTDSRFHYSKPAPVREDANTPATHPVHVLAEDVSLMRALSAIAEDIFGEHLEVDQYSAANRLRVGRPPVLTTESLQDGTHRATLLTLPELAEQGDGMKSLIGLVMPLVTRSFPVVLVDEPEAFLHPPQARALGRHLNRLAAATGTQVLLATHDRNVITGLLDGGTSDISIVRTDHRLAPPKARRVSPKEVREVWNEPVLRYTNSLDGLFHRVVVLVEAERDALFYAAATDAANDAEPLAVHPGEILFVPCGGKGGMARFATALHQLGVQVVVSPDIDILRNAGELKALIEALGQDWRNFEADYNLAIVGVDKSTTALLASDLAQVVGTWGDGPLTDDHRRTVERFLRTAKGGWGQVKAGGILALGTGGTGAAAERLFDALDAVGVVIVRVGELEGFAPGLNVAKGPAWVPAALAAGAHQGAEATAHARRVARLKAEA